jgi:hypothetical protein
MGLEGRELEKAKRLRMEGASYRSIARILNRPLSTVYESLKDVQVEADIEDGVIEIIDKRLGELIDTIKPILEDIFYGVYYLVISHSDRWDEVKQKELEKIINDYLSKLEKLKR